MEKLKEKLAFAWEKPDYDSVPLIDRTSREKFQVNSEDLRYYVTSPFGMKLRLLLFWILWAALIIALITSMLAYFCFQPQMSYISNKYEHHKQQIIVNISSHVTQHDMLVR